MAHLKDEECEPGPAGWFAATFGKPPGYSELLDMLAKSPAERNQLLRGYFEPTQEEREQGQKIPTGAHKAVAELAVHYTMMDFLVYTGLPLAHRNARTTVARSTFKATAIRLRFNFSSCK